ncbi:hypothetical protein HDU97_002728 [Phlyctochytrium planicorne]|nr:hypothetical protein HDU97_002728 [Phlyctochytrium planicorne]
MKFTSVVLATIAVAAVSVQAAPVAVPVAIANIDAPMVLAVREPEPVDDGSRLVNIDRRSWFKKFLKKALKFATKLNPVTRVIGAVSDVASSN